MNELCDGCAEYQSQCVCETDEEIVKREVLLKVTVADGRVVPTYDLNPAIVIESVTVFEGEGSWRMEMHAAETWALVRLLLKALEEYS